MPARPFSYAEPGVQGRIAIHIGKLPHGALVHASDFELLGTRAAIDKALSRLRRAGKLRRCARGQYWVPWPHGQGEPTALQRALEAARRWAGGPAGLSAAHFLKLGPTEPTIPQVAVVGGKPRGADVPNAEYVVRSNALRVPLNHHEIALLEVARDRLVHVTLDAFAMRYRLRELVREESIVPKRLAGALRGEPQFVRRYFFGRRHERHLALSDLFIRRYKYRPEPLLDVR